jgi:Reverse transcriptase (RNA-dependent DNA polymerase)/Endonuclease-reverse transcriptase
MASSVDRVVLVSNIQSLVSNLHLLRAHVSAARPMIVLLNEAQVPANVRLQDLRLDDYEMKHYPAVPPASGQQQQQRQRQQSQRGTAGGGTVAYFHSSVVGRHLADISLARLPSRVGDADYGRTSSIHWFEASLPGGLEPVLLGCVYVSPQSHRYRTAIDALLANIQSVMESYSHRSVLIAGDFNLRTELWDKHVQPPDSSTWPQYHWAKKFYTELTVDLGLTLLNTHFPDTAFQATRPASDTVLDLCFANSVAMAQIRSLVIGETLFADHYSLTVRFSEPAAAEPAPRQRAWRIHDHPDRWQRALPRASVEAIASNAALRRRLLDLDPSAPRLSPSQAQRLIQRCWTLFLSALTTAMGTCIRHAVKSDKFWFQDRAVREQYKRMEHARQRLRRRRRSRNVQHFLERYREQRQLFKVLAAKARETARQQLFESVQTGPASPLLWSAVARMRGLKSSSGMGCIANADGSLPSCPRQSLNNLCERFVEFTRPERPIRSRESTVTYVGRRLQQRDSPPHPSDRWSWSGDDVQLQCHYQRNHRSAAGPDGIPPLVLKYLGSDCYRVLALIFSFSWRYSVLPQEWTEANVFALVKDPAKPLSDPNNYRPISVTSIFIRTFEHLIHHRLTQLVDSPSLPRPLLYEHQYGFRRARSCDNALHLVLSSIQDEQRRSQLKTTCLPLPVVFVDLKKAFDRVWHHQLMATLETDFGISGRAWYWIWQWLHCRRRIRCVSRAHQSDWHPLLDYGVPQGAVLSPLLFLLFINPIAMRIDRQCPLIRMPMFADDIAILPKSEREFQQWWKSPVAQAERRAVEQEASGGPGLHDIDSDAIHDTRLWRTVFWRDRCYAIQMQQALALLSDWLQRVGMQANASKTKLVVFTSLQPANQTWRTDDNIQHQDSWYHQLTLDGFSVSLAHQYEYLGLVLDSRLQWSAHIDKVKRAAVLASNTVCRLFASQQHKPHPRAALRLVQSLVVPTITYGIHFWLLTEPCESLHRDDIDKLQALVLRPLRMAVDLPVNTHRLGVLVDFGLPSLHDMALQSRIRYYSRYLSDTVLRQPLLQRLTGGERRLLHAGSVPQELHPAVVRLIQDAHYRANVGSRALTNIRKWTTLGASARFTAAERVSSILTNAKQLPALQTLKLVRQHVPLPRADAAPASPAAAAAARPAARLAPAAAQARRGRGRADAARPAPAPDPPPAAAPIPVYRFTHGQIAAIAQLSTFLQWQAQWKVDHKRCTTAPLTLIKQQPGVTLLLQFITDKRALTTLMRLRHGRALTQDVRIRFPSFAPPPGDQSQPQPQQPVPTEPFCLYPPCRAQQVNDSASHQLLQCPQHAVNRQKLVQKWSRHAFGRGHIAQVTDLTLALVLGEGPRTYSSSNKQNAAFMSWFAALSDFIEQVYDTISQTSHYAKPL